MSSSSFDWAESAVIERAPVKLPPPPPIASQASHFTPGVPHSAGIFPHLNSRFIFLVCLQLLLWK